jgi:hypothetical protein
VNANLELIESEFDVTEMNGVKRFRKRK